MRLKKTKCCSIRLAGGYRGPGEQKSAFCDLRAGQMVQAIVMECRQQWWTLQRTVAGDWLAVKLRMGTASSRG